MIWITTNAHFTISSMNDVHLRNCINYMQKNCKPSDKISNYKAKEWCKAMSKELNNRKIAKLENLKRDLSAMNKKLLAQFNACDAEIKSLKENNDNWDKYPF